ncbi:MAG: adenylate/guanylate cyclase domain-containing protein [Nitrospirae bacterium]|nr:adenylate/guanylate cyclase domain-containing protein [Nitrospirota bacterium]
MDEAKKWKEWVIMFVDMVDSTKMKYSPEYDSSTVHDLIKELYDIIENNTPARKHFKFTGDGAMITYSEGGAKKAIEAAESIIEGVDMLNFKDPLNLKEKRPIIHIRIGIATGKCEKIGNDNDLIGKKVDLAARLCAEADIDTILVDYDTKFFSKIPESKFIRCKRRLMLKGVESPDKDGEYQDKDGKSQDRDTEYQDRDAETQDNFYFYKNKRFLQAVNYDHYSRGLLSLYPDRDSLFRDFTQKRIIRMAAKDSTILVAGRTLISWTKFADYMKYFVKKNNIEFNFLISNKDEAHYLDAQQEADINAHIHNAISIFSQLEKEDAKHFHFRETKHLILDGLTCAEIKLRAEEDHPGKGKLIVLQDINAAAGDSKAALLFTCTCNTKDKNNDVNKCIVLVQRELDKPDSRLR